MIIKMAYLSFHFRVQLADTEEEGYVSLKQDTRRALHCIAVFSSGKTGILHYTVRFSEACEDTSSAYSL